MPVIPDPGYGPNGERIDPSGRVAWSANSPPEHTPSVDDEWRFYALGTHTVPYIDQNDDEVWSYVYPGGA